MQLNPRLYPEARYRQEEVFAAPAGCDQAHQNGCAPHQEGYENPAEIGSPGELWGKAAVGIWHLAKATQPQNAGSRLLIANCQLLVAAL